LQAREQTLTHLRLVASLPGYWELRALQRLDGGRMEPRGSFFIIASAENWSQSGSMKHDWIAGMGASFKGWLEHHQ
jgi:hypothetical protein